MRARHALPALLAVVALMLSGCADNSKPAAGGATANSSASEVKKDDAAAALLPGKVAKAGKLVIGTSPNYAPNEFKDYAGNPIGWAIEVSDAIAAKLGLKADYQIARFENIIPGSSAARLTLANRRSLTPWCVRSRSTS